MILDTSVLLDAVIETPFTPLARSLIGSEHELFAPDHIQAEAAGAVTKAVRRGDLTVEAARMIYPLLDRLMPNLEPSAGLLDRAFMLSLELGHPLSDCLFVALAERKQTRLVTLDIRLVRKLAATPHAAHILALTDWRA